jgi:hypothetical protein
VKATREWVSADGIRCSEVPGIDGPCVQLEDLAKWLLTIDPAEVGDARKREAFARFQREAALMQPAGQHRRALELLRDCGCNTSNLELKPTVVR